MPTYRIIRFDVPSKSDFTGGVIELEELNVEPGEIMSRPEEETAFVRLHKELQHYKLKCADLEKKKILSIGKD